MNKLAQPTTKERKPKTKIEIVILVLLWGLIAYGAWNKYYPHKHPEKPKVAPTAPKTEDPEHDF